MANATSNEETPRLFEQNSRHLRLVEKPRKSEIPGYNSPAHSEMKARAAVSMPAGVSNQISVSGGFQLQKNMTKTTKKQPK